MPKPVEAPNPYVSPPVANIEDMTQPMGPLEEGDQALVDAAHRLPEGQHEIRHGDESVTWVNKSESLGQDVAVINTMTAEGAHESAGTLINTVPGAEGISADMAHSTAWDQGSGSRAHVSGNRIGSDVLQMKVGSNRREAQAIKLEVAGKIDAAAEQIGQQAVEEAAKQ
jgi:hypothetical protein